MLTYYTTALTAQVSTYTAKLAAALTTAAIAAGITSVSQLRGMSKGRANYSMKLERYEVVPPNIQTEIVAKVRGFPKCKGGGTEQREGSAV